MARPAQPSPFTSVLGDNRMKTNNEHRQALGIGNILLWISLLMISGFYIISSLGWFAATYMMASGAFGEEATGFFRSLSVADHFIRAGQVVLIVVASALLIMRKRASLKLFMASWLLSLVGTFLVAKWGISFLGGLVSLALLTIVSTYIYWLRNRRLLH